MQPSFLPWPGFFDLMDQVDEFVYLDTVQFQKQSWQQRNRIVTNESLQWLTVPVLTTGRFGQKINQVQVKKEQFPTKHLKTIAQHYSKSRYFDHYWEDLKTLFYNGSEVGLLACLNMQIINWFIDKFQISTNISIASHLVLSEGRENRLLDIIKQKNCTEYLSPIGSAAYLGHNLSLFKNDRIKVYFHNYRPVEYNQLGRVFVPFASALDLLFNEGPNSAKIIRAGRLDKLSIDELK